MKIQLMSDLHHEFGHMTPLQERMDTVLVLAGDIDSNLKRLKEFILEACDKYEQVFFVCGNHEYYHHSIEEVHDFILKLEGRNFWFLNNDTVYHGGVNFIGATLWSDPNWGVFNKISDSALIEYRGRQINTNDISKFNAESIMYIRKNLQEISGPKIVITHFGPDERLMHPKWKQYPEMNSYFWSKGFEDDFQYVDAWLFGHTHDSTHLDIDGCQCISNPYGYHGIEPNWYFKKELVFEI